jgi:hypothetical protein
MVVETSALALWYQWTHEPVIRMCFLAQMNRLRRLMAFAERNRRSRRAISTIMANLMMLIIVVTLCSLLFVWAISSFGGYQAGAGQWFSSQSIANQERPSVESVFFGYGSSNCSGSSYCVSIYIRNVGTIPFTISSIYLNSTLYQFSITVPVGAPQLFTLNPLVGGQSLAHGDTQTITVATLKGTVVTTTWVS